MLPENWEALTVFLKCATQWRYAGMAGVQTGLDYSAVDVVLRFSQAEAPGQIFEQIQIIEAGAIEGFAERQDRQ